MSSVRPNMDSFHCFPSLPPELRCLVWEHCLPPLRDLKIGRFCSHQSRQFDYRGIVAVRQPIILQVCRESRQVAFLHGSFVPRDDAGHSGDNEQDPAVNSTGTASSDSQVWIDSDIRTVYLNFVPASLSRLRSLPSKIRAIASPPWTFPDSIREFLVQELNNENLSALKAVYYSLSGIIYDGQPPAWLEKYDPAASAHLDAVRDISFLHGEADFAILDLDNEDDNARLNVWAEAALQVKRAGQILTHTDDRPMIYHRTSTCYVRNLRTYWQTNRRVLSVRAAWEDQRVRTEKGEALHPTGERCRSERRMRFPELKPALVFGKSNAGAFFGRESKTRADERALGLLFSRVDVHPIRNRGASARFFRQLSTPFDCEGVCGTNADGTLS